MNYEKIYTSNLQRGHEYEDFISMQLQRDGIFIQKLRSQKFQLTGENSMGLEIKFDDRLKKTGNIYIETHEKAHPQNYAYVRSGIHRNDNSFLFGIGNYEVFYLFGKRCLQRLEAVIAEESTEFTIYHLKHKQKKTFILERKQTLTSKGFIMPSEMADALAEKTYNFHAESTTK